MAKAGGAGGGGGGGGGWRESGSGLTFRATKTRGNRAVTIRGAAPQRYRILPSVGGTGMYISSSFQNTLSAAKRRANEFLGGGSYQTQAEARAALYAMAG